MIRVLTDNYSHQNYYHQKNLKKNFHKNLNCTNSLDTPTTLRTPTILSTADCFEFQCCSYSPELALEALTEAVKALTEAVNPAMKLQVQIITVGFKSQPFIYCSTQPAFTSAHISHSTTLVAKSCHTASHDRRTFRGWSDVKWEGVWQL